MGYKENNLEIIKQKDGSIIERIGSVETTFHSPFIPWWVEVEDIKYSQTLYYPESGGESPFGVDNQDRGTDPYYDSQNIERFRCKGKSEFSILGFFGEKGRRVYDITIIPIIEGEERSPKEGVNPTPRVYLDVFKNKDTYSEVERTHSLEVHIKQEVFNNLKDLLLQKNLQILQLSVNFSEGKDIYHDQNLDSDIVLWKILNESNESCKTVEGKIRRFDFTTHQQSLSGFRSGDKY